MSLELRIHEDFDVTRPMWGPLWMCIDDNLNMLPEEVVAFMGLRALGTSPSDKNAISGLADMIDDHIWWAVTPQGSDQWNDVHNMLLDGTREGITELMTLLKGLMEDI